MMRQFSRSLLVVCIVFFCSAHIGSPDAWFDGAAGSYRVLVHVKAPPVVPGIADVNIRVNKPVDTISAFVNKYDAIEGGPPPDVARPVDNAQGWYHTRLWVMDPGSNSVTVIIKGARGSGQAVIPIVAVAARRLAFNGILTAILGAAGLILVAGMLTLVGAAVRESVLPVGEVPDASRRKRARTAMMRGAIVIIVVVGGLGLWWRTEDSAFAQGLFKPLTAESRVQQAGNGDNQLVFTITDSIWTNRHRQQRRQVRGGNEFTTLVEDHQKLMHLFVIGENGSTSMAHLHPQTVDSVSFTATLPPLPEGRYHVYADILHESGFAQTLTSSITLAAPGKHDVTLSDRDDAWLAGATNSGAVASLSDSATLTWLGATTSQVAGAEASLHFRVTPPAGDSSALEPYLGMLGHAVVTRDDGAVFIHLHPMGTISTGAQTLLSHGQANAHEMSTMNATNDSTHSTSPDSNELHFPYAFPTVGNYTIWVQVKRNGRVLTGVFHTTVAEAATR